MASSLVTTECKRYGCMKNLLACFANCRYNTRCEDLQNELLDKTELATRDINQYLVERGRKPIVIQMMKRGLRFVETAKAEPPVKQANKANEKLKNKVSERHRGLQLISAKAEPASKQRNKVVMPKRVKQEASVALREEKPVANHNPVQAADAVPSKVKPAKPPRAKSKNGSRKPRAALRRNKVYIILEGKSASVVSEQGLMQHLFNNPTSGARYFEASEVEARVQIKLK